MKAKLITVGLLTTTLFFALVANAAIFGSVHGLIHDPQHRPVEEAKVTLRSTTSDWSQSTISDPAGEFHFENVPLGEYLVVVEAPGFATEKQNLVITSERDAKPHFSLTVAHVAEPSKCKTRRPP